MFIGRVIGNVWATKKVASLMGMKLLIVQPLTTSNAAAGEPIIAADTAGAGPGELILYITAGEAVIPLPVDMAPVDATIIGIIDSLHVES